MATVTRRLIIISLVIAIFAMVLAAAVANAGGTDHRAYARFCSSINGTECLSKN